MATTRQPLRIGFSTENWKISENKIICNQQFKAVVRNHPSVMNLKIGYMNWDNKDWNETFVLEIDYKKSEEEYSKKLVHTFGKHIYADFGEAAQEIAYKYCKENDLAISMEIVHWPSLQFVVVRNKK